MRDCVVVGRRRVCIGDRDSGACVFNIGGRGKLRYLHVLHYYAKYTETHTYVRVWRDNLDSWRSAFAGALQSLSSMRNEFGQALACGRAFAGTPGRALNIM